MSEAANAPLFLPPFLPPSLFCVLAMLPKESDIKAVKRVDLSR